VDLVVDVIEARLPEQYRRRFEAEHEARREVWRVLVDAWFGRYLDGVHAVLDLGCGWGAFVNHADVPVRYGLDLNPDAARHLAPGVELLVQSASDPWPVPDSSLDLVFSSNFLEHMPSRDAILSALDEASRCLRPGGRMVCVGPDIRYARGAYWDFFDHIVPLTARSLAEALELSGLRPVEVIDRFLPFTLAGKPVPPSWLIRSYLRLRPAWRVIGKQFLVVAEKPGVSEARS
jgi:SAM-dependent methyltransferase